MVEWSRSVPVLRCSFSTFTGIYLLTVISVAATSIYVVRHCLQFFTTVTRANIVPGKSRKCVICVLEDPVVWCFLDSEVVKYIVETSVIIIIIIINRFA